MQLSGSVSESSPGAGSLILSGDGQLILSGNGQYTGGTTVSGGTLDVASPPLFNGSSLTVGTSSSFNFDDASATGGSLLPRGTMAGAIASSPASAMLAAVPEPGTLALLSAAGIIALAGAWRRRRN